ncbi:MAG: EutP/PduV family microcompartment system protein [Bacillota bacterium]|jgi:ethanolamine utilization protein EutP
MENRKKRIILIGRTSAGKTTLTQYLSNEALKYRKTQAVEVVNKTMIDTPGEYLERTNYRGALQVCAIEADVIVLVQDPTEDGSMFPPAYASSFAKPVIGVVTKSDLAKEGQLERAKQFLYDAGAKEVYVTSSIEGAGFEALLEYLNYE